jgi:ABC-type cobalamin/Fe3+-siderophores transport system ATPase subunit
MNHVFSLKNCSGGYENNILWENLDLEISIGDLIAIGGPNGVGKSTLLKYLAGLLKPLSGEIKFSGKNLNKWSLMELAKRRSYLSQNIPDDIDFKVFEVVAMGLFNHSFKGISICNKNDIEKIQKYLNFVDMENFFHSGFNTLSGGEKQRVLLARALIQSNRIILMDEPTGSLDPAQTIKFMELLIKIQKKNNSTIIMVSHNIDLIVAYFPKLLLMGEKTVLGIGKTKEILTKYGVKSYGIPVNILNHKKYGDYVLMR